MLCHKCKEQIEVGEACTTTQVGTHTRYVHIGCAHNPVRAREDAKNEDDEWERVATLARSVH